VALISSDDLQFAEAISQLAYCNPFQQQRAQLEKEILAADYIDCRVDSRTPGDPHEHPNLPALLSRCSDLLQRVHAAHEASRGKSKIAPRERTLYEDVLLFLVYHQVRRELDGVHLREAPGPRVTPRALYETLSGAVDRFALGAAHHAELMAELPHIFAGFYQIRRAFHNIFHYILGVSRASIELRSQVWESIFTHDTRRYRTLLYARMADFASLITGPSGSGKELIARAIGLSRYIPYEPRTGTFQEHQETSFFPISLAAMSPTLIESELFGHQRGSFTGATGDRIGWLEACPTTGTVFLDEIGELEPAIQVKLLRVLQSREFSRLGETRVRSFPGKIIAATNRDLGAEIRAGRFREDLYYRLCSDLVTAPSLEQRVADDPGELRYLIFFIAQRLVGEGAASVADEVEAIIAKQLPPNYDWPGNIRELEQCVRNVLIRRSYRPRAASGPASADPYLQLAEQLRGQQLTAEELISRYCQLSYAQTGSYQTTARALGLDRRTVKSRVTGAATAAEGS
jgi:transcriptional regulator with AAA-type ATPase domain